MNFFKAIFKGTNQRKLAESVRQVDYSGKIFTSFSGNAYENDIFRSAVDAIARNAGKLKANHTIVGKDSKLFGNTYLNRILQVRPNPYMSSYDLFYKLVTHYFINNNAFAYLQKDEYGKLLAIYPLNPLSVEIVTDASDNLYCQFTFKDGSTSILSYNDVFIARRFFNNDEFLGDGNSAIYPTINLAHTQNEGIESSIKSSASIRGLIKYTQALSPDNLKAEKERFEREYLSAQNNGGLAAIDTKMDYIPLDSKPVSIDEKQLEAIETKIYKYLGISEAIVNSTYNEDEWSAFYESVLEPISLQFSLELTEKIFTKREQSFGNSILIEANRLQFASAKTKTEIIKELMPLGLLSVNQALEILNLPAVEDGDRRIQSLNHVNVEKVDEYQVGSRGNESGENNEDERKDN